jgi:hypothetical protein
VNSVWEITGPGATPIQYATGLSFYNAAGLVFDNAGNLFVCDGWGENSRIAEIDPTGDVNTFVSGLYGPAYIVIPEPAETAMITTMMLVGYSRKLLRPARMRRE